MSLISYTVSKKAFASTLGRRYKSTLQNYKSGLQSEPATPHKSRWPTVYNFMTKPRPYVGSMGAVFAHTSFIITATAYLSPDILTLRSLTFTSGFLMSSFQYFRAEPLFIALRWNACLMSINAYMVTNILMDRYAADHMPEDKQKIYDDGKFDERGFSKVHFKKFFDCGHLRVFNEEYLTHENFEISKLYYIIEGNASVCLDKDKKKEVATVTHHKFIGEMAFLGLISTLPASWGTINTKASANVRAKGEVHAWEWDTRTLAELLKEDRDLSNAFLSYCSHDLRMKLLSSNVELDAPAAPGAKTG